MRDTPEGPARTAMRYPMLKFHCGTGADRTGYMRLWLPIVLAVLGGCSTAPLVPYSLDTPSVVLVPASLAGVHDKRARFREIACTVLDTRKDTIPDYRPCEDALTMVGREPAAAHEPVSLGPSRRKLTALMVPGFGFDCFEKWLEPPGTVAAHLQAFGYDAASIRVEGLSGTQRNAAHIRDALMARPERDAEPRIVLVGYSKGANDVLEAIVSYPELRHRVAAVVSIAGSIGGSPLANGIEQDLAEWLRYFPGAECSRSDHGAVASLQPATRQQWLVDHPLPRDIPFYSLATLPKDTQISRLLGKPYKKLSRIDPRNDGQVLFYDQIIPGSTLVGYLNADHWAVAIPIARSHATIGSLLVTRNAYPREALMEALLRFIEEDLDERKSRADW